MSSYPKDRNIRLSNEFFRIAKDIMDCYSGKTDTCSIGKSEGLIRSGISRAYYAAFILARHALGLDYLETHEVHKIVVDRLKDSGYADIADKLASLRNKRNDADYRAYKLITVKNLEWAVHKARYIMEKILKYFNI